MAKNRDLPPRCYEKHGAFFYVEPKTTKWVPLGRDKDAALAKYNTLVSQPGALSVGTMKGLVDTAMPTILRGKADSTAEQYTLCAKRIKKVFAEFKVEDVKPKHIAQVKMSMQTTPNMANRTLSVLRLLFAYAVEQQLCDWNPAIGIKPFEEKKRDRLLSEAEIAKVLAVAPPRMQALVGVLRLTGQRVGDVLALRRSAITDDGLVFKQEKTGAKLLIRWTPDLRAAVDAALALHTHVKALTLFVTRTGGQPSYRTIRDQWQRAVQAAGVSNANLHDLRAVAVTDAHRQGLDPQALAGHSSRSMTARYIRDKMGVEVTPPSLSKKVSNFRENR